MIIKELMLGNYVLDKLGNIRMVSKITPMFIWFNNSEHNLIKEISGLPLTEKILHFLAWKETSKTHYKKNIVFNKTFSSYGFDYFIEEKFVIVNGILTVSEIRYAHQLQNLVKTISGKNNLKTPSKEFEDYCSDILKIVTL